MNPSSIQWCSKLNTGDLLEDSDLEHSDIISTAKKIMLMLFALADKENSYYPDGKKKKLFFVLSICISKVYSPPVVLFDEVPL